MIKITRGMDLPISGEPEQSIYEAPKVRSVALVGYDYVGLKPTMVVAVGDKVRKGQLLFTDKKAEGVRFTAPAAGTVAAINRGAKRSFQSLVIDVEGDDQEQFTQYSDEQISQLERDQVVQNLVESGLWTALRTRPFSKVPVPASEPQAIFINAMDSNPLAGDPERIIAQAQDDFERGLMAVSKLSQGNSYLVKAGLSSISAGKAGHCVREEQFSGPHPAGAVGTHVHFLDPVAENKTVWTLNYQDVIAIGHLFATGELSNTRVISLAGPSVEQPRLIRTQLGVDLQQLCSAGLKTGNHRLISGSVLAGREATSSTAYLGRYHLQVSALAEGYEREFMGWLSAGANRHSAARIYLSQFFSKKTFSFNTSTNGSPRAIVPIGSYEKVMPLDILPTQLLRALVVGDIEMAIKLGALELDEEDLALCTYVCPGKYEYGPILRDNLTRIEKEA